MTAAANSLQSENPPHEGIAPVPARTQTVYGEGALMPRKTRSPMSRARMFPGRARPILRNLSRALLLAAFLLPVLPAAGPLAPGAGIAMAATKVPEGNRNAKQPRIPFASARRTSASRSAYDSKFERILNVLRRDSRLMRDIKRVARTYGIDPIHMIGAIVGEHTYNYDSLDSAQSYYVKALSYAGIRMEFAYDGTHVADFVQRPEFKRCNAGSKESGRLWTCYERIWNSRFRGKSVDGTRYPHQELQRGVLSAPVLGPELWPRPALSAHRDQDERQGRQDERLFKARCAQRAGDLPLNDGSGKVAPLHGRRVARFHRRLQAGREHGHFRQSRTDRDALQSRQPVGPCVGLPPAPSLRSRALAGGKLLRLAGQRQDRGTAGAALGRNHTQPDGLKRRRRHAPTSSRRAPPTPTSRLPFAP